MADKKDDKKGDKKGDKDAAGADDIMAPAAMKPILALAKRGSPVSAAICLTKEKDGIILLDKKRKPKKVLAELKKLAGAAGIELETTTLRFGKASVDTDQDAGLVTFTDNKDTSGAMRPKLLERLKKAGFTKVEIVVDAGLEQESEEDDEAPAPAAAAGAQPGAAPPAAPQAPGQPGAPAAAAQPNPLDAMTKELAELMKSIPALPELWPSGREDIVAMASLGTKAIKAGDAGKTRVCIDLLREKLDGAQDWIKQHAANGADGAATKQAADGKQAAAAPAAESPAVKAALATVDTSRKAWMAARKRAEDEVHKLKGAMGSAYEGHGFSADLDKLFQDKVVSVFAKFDGSLNEKLAEVSKSADPAERAKRVQEAQKILSGHEQYLASEPLIAKLDNNPFVALSIQKTFVATIQALSKSLSTVANTMS